MPYPNHIEKRSKLIIRYTLKFYCKDYFTLAKWFAFFMCISDKCGHTFAYRYMICGLTSSIFTTFHILTWVLAYTTTLFSPAHFIIGADFIFCTTLTAINKMSYFGYESLTQTAAFNAANPFNTF